MTGVVSQSSGPFGWTDAPKAVRERVDDVLGATVAVLGDNLAGFYLHGSLAMDCFSYGHSDIDLIAVTLRKSRPVDQRGLAELFLAHSTTHLPVEISFLNQGELATWRHPMPFDFHFSETWRTQYEADLRTGGWRTWGSEASFDTDLAAHLTVLRDRGVVLLGDDPEVVFPAVPAHHFRAAIMEDLAWARDRLTERPEYFVLNACRVLEYRSAGVITSKCEAARWAAQVLPTEFHSLVADALAVHLGRGNTTPLEPTRLRRFAEFVAAAGHASAEVGG